MAKTVVIGPDDTAIFRASAQERVSFAVDVIPPDAPPPMDDPPVNEFLPIQLHSQRDPRWANVPYAGGATFAATGCLVVAIAMIASLITPDSDGDPTSPPEVARKMRDAGCFAGAFLSHPSRIPDALPLLEWGGVMHWRRVAADLSVLKAEIAAHGATICEVLWNPQLPISWDDDGVTLWNQHFVVVEGVNVAADTAVIIDPWDGQRKAITESRYVRPGWGAARALYGVRLVRTVTD